MGSSRDFSRRKRCILRQPGTTMTPLSKETILEALQSVQDPDLNKNIVELGFVIDLAVCDGSIRFTLELTTPACPVKEQLKEQLGFRKLFLLG